MRLNRTSVKFPPTDNNRFGTVYGAMCGTLVRVEIVRATGALRRARTAALLPARWQALARGLDDENARLPLHVAKHGGHLRETAA